MTPHLVRSPEPFRTPRFDDPRVRRIIEQGITAGTVRGDADASAEAIQFCGALFGLGLQWLIDPTGSRIEDMHQRFKERLEAALRP